MVLPWKNLDRRLGLHQRLEVIYVVVGYEAQLLNEDESIVAEARGETVQEAIDALDTELEIGG